MNTRYLTTVINLAAWILIGPPAYAQPFTNGGFELPEVTALYPGPIPGWDLSKSEGRLWFGPAYNGVPNPAEGVQHFEIGKNDSSRDNSISQTFSTVLGGEYRVSFQVGWGGNDVRPRKSVRAIVASDTGETLASLDANAPATRSYGPVQSFTFRATTGAATLTFLETSPDHYQASLFLDNVHVGLVPPELCGTLVGGSVGNANWSKVGSPYCVTNDVTIVGNVNIGRGVEVKLLGNYVIEVRAKLQARGTGDEPIRFYPADPAVGWQGLLFPDSVPGSFFLHTVIEGSRNSGVRILNTPVAFTNCVLQNNGSPSGGGGIQATVTTGKLVLDHCQIVSNTSLGHGGGISLVGAGEFASCDVINNGCLRYGGGIFLNGSAELSVCTIARNRTRTDSGDGAGGGVSVTGPAFPALRLWNCEVSENQAYDGGGFSVSGSDFGAGVRQHNCKVLRNRATGAGGGLLLYRTAQAEVVNGLFTENQPNAIGFWDSNSRLRLTNSIVFYNGNGGAQIRGAGASSAIVRYSVIQGGGWPGDGNISAPPALCSNGSLIEGSPCIDAGHPGFEFRDGCVNHAPCSPFARGGARSDIGAYGGPGVCYWTEPRAEPVIRIAPVNTIGLESQPVSLDVLATGREVLTYQWWKDGMPLPNQTNAVLTYPSGSLDQAGANHVVVVSNDLGATTSVPVHLGIAKFELRVDSLLQGQPRLRIGNGKEGEKCAIYSISLLPLGDGVVVPGISPKGWELRDTLTFTSSEMGWTDPRALGANEQRFYGAQPPP